MTHISYQKDSRCSTLEKNMNHTCIARATCLLTQEIRKSSRKLRQIFMAWKRKCHLPHCGRVSARDIVLDETLSTMSFARTHDWTTSNKEEDAKKKQRVGRAREALFSTRSHQSSCEMIANVMAHAYSFKLLRMILQLMIY